MNTKRYLIYVIAVFLSIGTYGVANAAKCGTGISFGFDPGTTVDAGTSVIMTETVTVTTSGSNCGSQVVGTPVISGTAKIQAVMWNGQYMTCADVGAKYCSQGKVGETCTGNGGCNIIGVCTDGTCSEGKVGDSCSGDGQCNVAGVCTAVVLIEEATENPTDGIWTYTLNTTGLGGQTLGFQASYTGNNAYNDAPVVCTNVTVNEEEPCSGATISIHLATGDGAPAPGGPYDWSFEVVVHACEALKGVTAQGGTNGWAELVGRSEDSLHPDTGTAVIRKANKKTDVILWTIGDMVAGQDAKLTVDLSGSIPNRTPDCQVRFLSGPWSAIFSTDGISFEKTDYTGRVFILVDSDGDGNADCGL